MQFVLGYVIISKQFDERRISIKDKKENTKTLAQNKKARHEYFILETIEAGIELAGTEVKSARLGKVNLTDAYASIKNGEVFIKQMNISPFEQGNIFNRDPLRDRKLLLHKKEICFNSSCSVFERFFG